MSQEVINPTSTRHTSHLVSDLQFWKDAWKLLANANYEHKHAIEKFLSMTDKQIDKLGPRDILLDAEKTFVEELRLLQGCLREQKESFQRDSTEYIQLENNVNQYIQLEKYVKHNVDYPELQLSQLNHSLTEARHKLETQTGLVGKCKQEYHKSLWHIEKAGIKVMLAVKGGTLDEMKKQMEDLEKRAADHLDKYNKHYDKWIAKLDNVVKLSHDYEVSYVSQETSRAAVVLKSLQDSFELTNNGNFTRIETMFGDIDIETIIREKLIKKDSYDIPILEDYKERKGVERMYARARALVKASECDKSTDWVPRKANVQADNHDERMRINKRLRQMKFLYLVIREYRRQELNQLNLKVGDFVRQLLPPNDDGFAFGQVVHGKIRRKKKKGFYPYSHTKPVKAEEMTINLDDVSDLDDDEADHTGETETPSTATSKKYAMMVFTNESQRSASPRLASPRRSAASASDIAAACKKCEADTKEIKKRNKIFRSIVKSGFIKKLRGKGKNKHGGDETACVGDVTPTDDVNTVMSNVHMASPRCRPKYRNAASTKPRIAWADDEDEVAEPQKPEGKPMTKLAMLIERQREMDRDSAVEAVDGRDKVSRKRRMEKKERRERRPRKVEKEEELELIDLE